MCNAHDFEADMSLVEVQAQVDGYLYEGWSLLDITDETEGFPMWGAIARMRCDCAEVVFIEVVYIATVDSEGRVRRLQVVNQG